MAEIVPIRSVAPVESILTDARRILRGLVLVATDPSEDSQKRVSTMLDGLEDARLIALATEALTNVKRVKASYNDIEGSLKEMRKELERVRKELAADEAVLLDAQKAQRERDDIAAKYQELKKQLDPEKHQLEIMYAIEEATKALKDDGAALRRELAQRQTEVNELRDSKKRLREAVNRLAGKI